MYLIHFEILGWGKLTPHISQCIICIYLLTYFSICCPRWDDHLVVFWFSFCAWQQQTLLLLVGLFTGSTSGTNMVHVQQNHLLWIVNINTSARLWNCTIKWIWTGTAHHTVKLSPHHFLVLFSNSQHCLDICNNCVFAVLSLVHINPS